MELKTEYLIEYLHTSTNNIYSINYEINKDEYDEFQKSDNPEELGFTFDRAYVIPEPIDPSEN
jgi:hypothetical protein